MTQTTGDLVARCILPARAHLGECPLWSVDEDRLYWIDIDGQAVHRFDPATGVDEQRAAPGRPGSIVLTKDRGRLLVAIEDRLAVLDWPSGAWLDWVPLEPSGTGNRMNDGRTDPAGRFWVGSMFVPTSAKQKTGMLHRIEPDGSTAVMRSGIGVSNGLAFSSDGRTMYFADTHRDVVWAYDYDLATGTPTAERVFLDFEPLPGHPDGACIDAEGFYWIACVHGSAVLRVSPAGDIERRIEVPARKPTMPAFGGPDLTTLFITTIGSDDPDTIDPAQPDAGGLFSIETGIRGRSEPVFAGTLPDPTA